MFFCPQSLSPKIIAINIMIEFEVLINDDFCRYCNNDTLIDIDNAKLLSIINDFEDGEWRYKKFQNFIWNNIKDTALNEKERQSLIGDEGSIIERAVSKLRLTEDSNDSYNGKGGEIGEIVLYGIMRRHYKALPVVPKIFHKQNKNDFAKGADSVHIVVENEDEFSLWFGESKFYNEINNTQIDKVIESVSNSLQTDKLKKEKSIIIGLNDINEFDEISEKLKSKILELLSEDTSIDKIKPILNIPILILHECGITKNETELKDEYRENIITFHKERATKYFEKQVKKCSSIYKYSEIKFHLILFPVPDKSKIEDKFLTIAKAHK